MTIKSKTLVLKRSNRLLCFYIVSMLLALMAVFFINKYQWIVGLYVLIVAGFYYYRHFSGYAVKKIHLHDGSRIDLESDNKIWRNVRLLPSSRVYAFCIVLNFKTGIFKHQTVILSDSLTSEEFRELRVYLRFME